MGAPSPDGIDAMAEDLLRLQGQLETPAVGVVGHSLGGKVALAFAARCAGRLDEVWVLDAQPGPREGVGDESIRAVLETLRELPDRFADRRSFVEAVVERGRQKTIAQWLAMNLRPSGDQMRLNLELDRIERILDDYFGRDLWPELARVDDRRRLHVVVAGDSPVWSAEDRDRLETIAAQHSAVIPHLIEGAAHWVHVDAADELRRLFVEELGT